MNPRSDKYYVVLDDDETWSTDGYIVLDASLTKEQRDDLRKSDAKVFKYEGVPFISIDELIETLDKAGIWDEIFNELARNGDASSNEVVEIPSHCPFCGSSSIVDLEMRISCSLEGEPTNCEMLNEYQCRNDACCRSFWI